MVGRLRFVFGSPIFRDSVSFREGVFEILHYDELSQNGVTQIHLVKEQNWVKTTASLVSQHTLVECFFSRPDTQLENQRKQLGSLLQSTEGIPISKKSF